MKSIQEGRKNDQIRFSRTSSLTFYLSHKIACIYALFHFSDSSIRPNQVKLPMNYSSGRFCLPHQQLNLAGEACMATASDVSDYFANTPDNLTLLSMLPCTSRAAANNSISSYNSERMLKHAVPIATNSSMFVGEEGDGVGGRWPRQETLTLLEVRSRLHARFRQSTQKAPLWDEVSRY
jgi:hypothetical protein